MGNSFKNPAAFRMSLEQRLKNQASESSVPINALRLKVAIERLLARLFAVNDPPWLLKGGYAMELRYRPRARTTKDIDLSVKAVAGTLADRQQQVRDELQEAAETDPGDFFVFQIIEPSSELQGAPDGGARFSINALMVGRSFARFHLDVGFGDSMLSTPESLVGQDFLNFADIPPANALAIPKAQQFAEKIHAYSRPWTDRPNTRTKDLIDLVLFLTVDAPSMDEVREAVKQTFELRATHEIPELLPNPPDAWRQVYEAMARDAGLLSVGIDDGFKLLEKFWYDLKD